jgi:hypothetical protein
MTSVNESRTARTRVTRNDWIVDGRIVDGRIIDDRIIIAVETAVESAVES